MLRSINKNFSRKEHLCHAAPERTPTPITRCRTLRAGTRVTVIGGYIGSGKTTLIRHLLLDAGGRRLAALVQDPSALQLPKPMIAYWDAEITGLTNGNAYCSVMQGPSTALHDLIHRVGPPDHVLLETRADESLSAALRYVEEMGLALDGLIVVADAERLPALATSSIHQLHILRQVHQADLVILNKIDLLTPDQLARTRAWLAGAAPGVRRIETEHAAAPTPLLIGAPPEETPTSDTWRDCDAWCFESTRALDRDALHAVLRSLPEGIIRAEGTVHLADEPGVPHTLQHIGRRSIFKREVEGSVPWPQTKIILSGLRNSGCAQTLEKALCHAAAPGYASLRALSTPPTDNAKWA